MIYIILLIFKYIKLVNLHGLIRLGYKQVNLTQLSKRVKQVINGLGHKQVIMIRLSKLIEQSNTSTTLYI